MKCCLNCKYFEEHKLKCLKSGLTDIIAVLCCNSYQEKGEE